MLKPCVYCGVIHAAYVLRQTLEVCHSPACFSSAAGCKFRYFSATWVQWAQHGTIFHAAPPSGSEPAEEPAVVFQRLFAEGELALVAAGTTLDLAGNIHKPLLGAIAAAVITAVPFVISEIQARLWDW